MRASAKQAKPADDGLGIPEFLRVTPKEAERRRATWDEMARSGKMATVPSDEKPETVWLTPLVRLAENAAEEAGFSIKKGVVPRRWAHDKKLIANLHDKMDEAHSKAAEGLRRLREGQEAKPKPYEGMIALKVLLGQMTPPVKRRHAVRAIEEAKLIHKKLHFRREDAELVKSTIRKWSPPPSKRRVEKTALLDRGLTIRYTAKDNPKKPGTGAHERWEKLRSFSGRTVGEYLDDGGNPATLLNAVSQGRAEMTDAKAERADGAKVPRKDGERVRGEAKASGKVASGKRGRRANARGRAKR